MNKKIFVIDNELLLYESLKSVLSNNSGYLINGITIDIKKIRAYFNENRPDILIIDPCLPGININGIIQKIIKENPAIKILAVSNCKEKKCIKEALNMGAKGYFLKSDGVKDLLFALENIWNNQLYLNPQIKNEIISNFLTGEGKKNSILKTLTQREKEILKLIAQGVKNKDIAKKLFISVKTVGNHRTNLIKKLDIHDSSSLTRFAIKNKLISI